MRQPIAHSILAAAAVVNCYTVIDHDQFMTKNMDPIVWPGQYKSHMHSFFGSDGVTAELPTSADLQQGCYSGDNANDLSVYWIPTLYYVQGDTYTEVKPYRFSTYYNNINYAEIPFPQDMYAIAGNAAARDQSGVDEANNGMNWFCEGDPSEDKDGGRFPSKTCSTHLQTILRFPDCINPNDLSEPAVYSPCPENMLRIPELRYSIRYDLRKIIPDGWSGTAPLQLACGGEVGEGYCFHGDFINGWYEDALDFMMTEASDKRVWSFISGSHASSQAEDSCQPTDRQPNEGTSDYKESLQTMGDVATSASSGSDSTDAETADSPSLCKRQGLSERRRTRPV